MEFIAQFLVSGGDRLIRRISIEGLRAAALAHDSLDGDQLVAEQINLDDSVGVRIDAGDYESLCFLAEIGATEQVAGDSSEVLSQARCSLPIRSQHNLNKIGFAGRGRRLKGCTETRIGVGDRVGV